MVICYFFEERLPRFTMYVHIIVCEADLYTLKLYVSQSVVKC